MDTRDAYTLTGKYQVINYHEFPYNFMLNIVMPGRIYIGLDFGEVMSHIYTA